MGSFKQFIQLLDSDLNEEQLNEIFGLFRNNKEQNAQKIADLRKQRAALAGKKKMTDAELKAAMDAWAAGQKKVPGKISHDDLEAALSANDRKALTRMDRERDVKNAELAKRLGRA
jgi:uncharacterized protein YfeS